GLAQDRAARLRGGLAQQQQRRLADGVGEVAADAGGGQGRGRRHRTGPVTGAAGGGAGYPPWPPARVRAGTCGVQTAAIRIYWGEVSSPAAPACRIPLPRSARP